jgi:CheY-like chemotaxis protein
MTLLADADDHLAVSRGERVLLVDDNRDAAESLGEALEELGYLTEVVHDGAAALRVASDFRPAIALLDIGLPVMDGYELAGLLRTQLGPDVPRIVAITGYGCDADRVRSEVAGFAAHLVKPIDLDQLESVLDTLIGGGALVSGQ